jgi:light-regulated signal transduction histidine kinase (bacteriophytochrome)
MQAEPERQRLECFVPLYSDSMHDLAGPVNQISTMLELYLARHTQSRANAQEQAILNLLQDSTTRLGKLLDAMQSYLRLSGLPREFRQCDCDSLLSFALGSLDPLVRESGAVVTRDEIPAMCCDPNQLVYAFICLLETALKFRGDLRPEIRISVTPQGGDWLLSICDNGIGIDARHHEAVFHMFKRIHGDRYPGIGAGLAITRRIIEEHGGRIWVESEPGRGSTFFFTLPRAGAG